MIHRLKSFRSMKEHQQDCELSTVLQNSMAMFGGSVVNMQNPHSLYNQSGVMKGKTGLNPHYPQQRTSATNNRGSGGTKEQSMGQRSTSPESSFPAYMRSSSGSYGQQGMPSSQPQSNYPATNTRGVGIQNMPSMLRSVLRNENIDYENDFYWLSKVRILCSFS